MKAWSNSKALSFLWLLPGAVLWAAYVPSAAVPAAAWLAPVFLLRFSRRQKPAIGLPVLAVTFVVIEILTNQGMSFIWPGASYFLWSAFAGLPWVLPFLADRLLARRMPGFAATLVFPLAYVGLEYLTALSSPGGTWGSLAYSQQALPLLQVLSITGLWGITFLVTWFAPVANWVWEEGFVLSRTWPGLALYAGVLAAVLLWGGARLAFSPPRSDTVRIASITTPYDEAPEHLARLTEQAILFGAQVVLWQEGAILIPAKDEPALVEAYRALARQAGVYLGLAVGVLPPGFPTQPGRNKIVWIDPDGEVLFEYHKAKLVPHERFVPGEGELLFFDSPYGRIASPICFDMDFPVYLQQAGRAKVDIILVPANDWPGVTPMHGHMASFRGIEQGAQVVRATGHGLSAAYDYQGRTLSAKDANVTDEQITISDVPVRGVTTFYGRAGDLFAWLCLAGLAGMGVLVVVRRDRRTWRGKIRRR